MTSQRAFGIALIGSAIALFLFVAVVGSHASADSASSLTANLQASGYGVTSRGISQGLGISAIAKVLRIERDGAFASVQLYEYPDGDALNRDWLVNPGLPAQPRDSKADVAGRSAFWNDNSVLLVDFRAPNDPDLARRVGEVFLSQTGASLAPPIASSRQAEEMATSVQPPHTGDAALLSPRDEQALPVWAGALWAALTISTLAFAAAGGVVLLRKARE